MDALLRTIVVWLSTAVGTSANFEYPKIEYASPRKLDELSLHPMNLPGPTAYVAGSNVIAFYDRNRKTIVLREGWSGRTAREISVLVHEMVHHLQNVNGDEFACPAAREKPAYLAQDKWLKQFGLSLESEFDTDAFTVIIRSACVD